ncbi:MAG: hypothetical protein Q4Q31_07345 [Bacillota bacterium]|nr:hypothetical protein [Bacillota bacterium]
MKSILFTSIVFKNFAGSELVVLSQINYFLEKKWDVDVFTLEYDQPLKTVVDKRVNVITLDNVDQIKKNYDLIIARQYPTLDYVLFTLCVQAKRVYYECVSYRIPVDAYPIYYKHLTLIGAVSTRVINEMTKIGYDMGKAYYMPNYAPKEYFDIDYQKSKDLKKIAIVSNHVPQELEDFKTYALENSNMQIDIYGMHHTYKLVTPELLKDYDLIISVGKTIFYSLAMGIPSYTYDEVCTEGYITLENYQKNFSNNFAYNLEYNKKTGKEIYTEIVTNYHEVLKQTEKLKENARRDFFFDDLMDHLLDKMMSENEIDYQKLYEEYPTLGYTARTYIEDRDFLSRENLKWYYKSLELGDLYQKEIGKTVDALGKYEVLLESYNSILNSKGWKLLEKVKKIKKR